MQYNQFTSLDVGCGMHHRGTVNIDISAYGRPDIIADAQYLPFKDRTFDLIIAYDLIEHLDDDMKFICKASRVLKDKGELRLVTPTSLSERFFVFLRRDWLSSLGHKRIYDYRALERLLASQGFRIISCRYQGFIDFWVCLLLALLRMRVEQHCLHPRRHKWIMRFVFLKNLDMLWFPRRYEIIAQKTIEGNN